MMHAPTYSGREARNRPLAAFAAKASRSPRLSQGRGLCQRAVLLLCVVTLCLSGGIARAAVISDDFEGYPTGTFPSPTWQDVALVAPDAPPYLNAPTPSATVVATTDAFGGPTQALQTDASLGVSRGIYASVPVSTSYTLHADIRTLQYANTDPSAFPADDWSMQLTFAQAGVANFSTTPQAGVYASSLTQGWRLFLIGANGGPYDDFDLGVAAAAGTWYTVQLDIDAVTGSFHSLIIDTATGAVLGEHTRIYGSWLPQYAAFDSIAFFGGETLARTPPETGSTTTPSVAQVDNVNILASPIVPEPATCALVAVGLAGLGIARGRREVARP